VYTEQEFSVFHVQATAKNYLNHTTQYNWKCNGGVQTWWKWYISLWQPL